MRFHTVIRIQYFDIFISTINSQSSISENSCFHISPEGIMMCSIQKDHTFSAYTQFRLEMFDDYLSESNNNNHIFIEFSAATLTKALSNTKSARSVKVKLSSFRGNPGLLFEIEMLDGINIRQDISVRLLQQAEFSLYDEPNASPPYLKLCVQKAKELRGVLSRMRIVDDSITIDANNQNILSVSNSNVTVLMETTFAAQPVDTDEDTVLTARMRVDIKALMKALASILIEPKAVHFCFNDVALIIYVVMKGNVGNITYYIPGQIIEE